MLDWTARPGDTRLNWNTNSHEYQRAGAAHLFSNRAATLWLDPGYGKTTMVLHAFKALREMRLAKNMLVVAPKRVMQTVWAQEVDNWSSLQGLRAARLHGPKKDKWLKRTDTNVWLINYEGLPWLAKMAREGKLPFKFDVVVFDEIRRMKNAMGKRFKAIRPIASMAEWVWGATGTPSANGLLDLFGQFLILDGGAALGTRITKFRHDYFELGYDGFTWAPRPGAREAIEAKIAHMVYRVTGQLDLPGLIPHPIRIPLEQDARTKYLALKRDLVADMGETTLTAANAAVLWGKLKQLANGRVYDENRNVIHVHDAKQEALAELVEELGDEQLLIAYEYNHDLEQIRAVLGDDIPYLGAGVSESRAIEIVDEWNARRIQHLAAHPASAGHGLNLQKGGAHHILWFGPTVDLDHYIQFIDRLLRQGNAAQHVVVHSFIAEGTVDEHADEAREGKDSLQGALLSALTAEIGNNIVVVEETNQGESPMNDLQFRSDAQQTAQQPAPASNPFAQGQQAPADQGQPANPFAQGQPQQPAPAPASNPFAQGQQTPADQGQPANPFAQGQPQQPAPAPASNPFAQGQQTPAAQQQAIQSEVAAPPAATPEQAFQNFQAQQQQTPAQNNPFAQGEVQTPIQDAEIIQEQPAPNITANPENRQPPTSDTGWREPHAASPHTAASQAIESAEAPAGMVPVFTMVPADKLDKVMSAIGRAVKK